MILSTTYQPEWLATIAEPLGNRGDKKILEKVLYAMTLLEQLKAVGLDFVFKGGTSLLLLFKENPRRFSIDIDIIADLDDERLTPYLDRVVALGSFGRYEPDNDRKHALDAPVGHYKFYYTSQIDTMTANKQEPILLDVLFTPNPYPKLREVSIEHAWLLTDGVQANVMIPEIESITGDKLTAFAPNTTGILYEKKRPVEVIKQLFDIGFLFDSVQDVAMVRAAYVRVAEEEIRYRKLDINWRDSLQDTFDTCLILSERNEKLDEFQFLLKGIKNIVNFILTRFHIDEAIICAAKTACLSALLLSGENVKPVYEGSRQISETLLVGEPYGRLNRLKKANPEAYFYWVEAIRLIV